MQIPEAIINAATTFQAAWRHPRLPPLECRELYSLFPQETLGTPARASWPDNWPYAERPGIYLVFGTKMQLLYVGQSGTLRYRLNSYFRWSAGRGSPCRIVHTVWKTRPTFIATMAVADAFEAATLDEYLIAEVPPAENRLGIKS